MLSKGKTAKVIYPAIPCKDGRDMTNYVSRVINDDRELLFLAHHKKELMEKLKAIDPEQRYFIYPEYCEPGELLESNREDGVTDENKHRSEIMVKAIPLRKGKQFNAKHLLKSIKLLHSNKILHGDIHSGNIVLGTDNLPRLIDFDSAIVNAPTEMIDLEKKYVRNISPSFSKYRDLPLYRYINTLARERYLDTITP
jgi:serine/threonine protein kinase